MCPKISLALMSGHESPVLALGDTDKQEFDRLANNWVETSKMRCENENERC
jgi:hypothetical protein